MTTKEFNAITAALRADVARFPNCSTANCECDSKHGEWRAGCYCTCHFKRMDQGRGKGKWDLNDFSDQAKTGMAK